MLIIYNSDIIRLCLIVVLYIYEDFVCFLGMYINQYNKKMFCCDGCKIKDVNFINYGMILQ